jgi:GT2 family glycosyltransferase
MRAPILVGELELTEPVSDVALPARDDGLAYNGVRLLVRMQHVPVGYVFLSPDNLDAVSITREVWRQLSSAINAQRSLHGLAAISTLQTEGIAIEEKLVDKLTEHPFVSVVLNTRDRPWSVVPTVRGILASRYQPFEIIVVDNAPSSDMTKDAVLAEFGDDPRVRYVREPRQGTSWAKNRGIAKASGEVIAFTDDDVRVDEWWLHGIVRGFERADDVACVTGLIATGALDNAVQVHFDQRARAGLLRKGRVFDLTDNRDDSLLYPYSAGVFGGGANFAMTRRALEELGGFDEALGAGVPCGGGEDNDVFMRTILAGHCLIYEPSAIVWHVYHTELGNLPKQMRAWGSGTTAALTALALHNPRARRELLRKVPLGAIRIMSIGGRTNHDPGAPSAVTAQELSGMVIGPWLYLKTRRELRRARRFTAGARAGAAGDYRAGKGAPAERADGR